MWEGGGGQDGVECGGWKWDNCNSIINKYILKTKQNKTKMVSLSAVGCLSPADRNHTTFYCWMLHGQLIPALALCGWEPFLGSRLLSSARKVPTDCCPWEWGYPLLRPHIFYQSQVDLTLLLIKSHFFQVVISYLF